jgi:hypothetical protein
MKKLLLIILLLSQPIYADSNGMSKLIIPHVTICDFDDPYPYNLVDLEREIAEFEAKLAKDLADKVTQEIMVEIEAEDKTKAKFLKLQPTVCKANRGGYEAYTLGIKN